MKIIETDKLAKNTELNLNENEWVYNGLDCCITQEILNQTKTQLDNVSTATYQFSLALQAPVMEMSMRGLLVDQNKRKIVLRECERDRDRLEEQFNRMLRDGVGLSGQFNWRSDKQVKDLMYGVLGLPPVKKRNSEGKMAPTVNRDALERLSNYFIAQPFCSRILALRDLQKRIEFLRTEIDSDGRFRTTLNIAGTNTGRLSSAESIFDTGRNVQNIDRRLREIFIADRGMKFANIDLEQADSRNLGALCWEAFLHERGPDFAGAYLDACESGDLHTFVCKMARPHLPWTGDPAKDREIADQKYYRQDSYRDLDKKLGHGSNFLGQPQTMAKHTKIPVNEVTEFHKNYFSAFPCVPAYHRYVFEELHRSRNLTTLFSRRRHFFGRLPPKKDAKWYLSDTVRDAVAYGPQSMTAEEINIGILELWRAFRVQLLLQVHDSILFQFPEELEDEIVPWACEAIRISRELSGGRTFTVPVEAKTGWNYGDFNEKKPEENPDGLKKYKGEDKRKRGE